MPFNAENFFLKLIFYSFIKMQCGQNGEQKQEVPFPYKFNV